MEKLRLKKCFLRYEPNIDNGTMFLFNKENGQMLEGDYYSYVVVHTLKAGEDLVSLAENIALENNRDLPEVQQEIEEILDTLSAKGFIEYE